MIKRLPSGLLDRLVDPWRPVPEGKEGNGQRLHRLADYAASRGDDDLHRKLVSRWRWPERGVVGGGEAASLLWEHVPPRGDLSTQERMMQLDLLTYLPDDILAKVDRAAMAVSLETRAPLLDHKVAEFALACPLDMKWRDGQSKWLLRQVLYRHVPRGLIERPKMGFEVPIGLWLRGALRDWAAALLDPVRLRREGLFNAGEIDRMWRQHLAQSHNWGLQLWPVLMVRAWLEGAR
jgi:asparagine synthase (glutamine-hydrolysing)